MTKSDQELRDRLATEWMMSPAPVHNCMSDEPLRNHFKDGFDSRQAQVDELRAENENLEKRFNVGFKNFCELRKERDQLKAEVKRFAEALGHAGITHVAPEHLSDDYQEGYCDAMEDIRAWAQIILKDEK